MKESFSCKIISTHTVLLLLQLRIIQSVAPTLKGKSRKDNGSEDNPCIKLRSRGKCKKIRSSTHSTTAVVAVLVKS